MMAENSYVREQGIEREQDLSTSNLKILTPHEHSPYSPLLSLRYMSLCACNFKYLRNGSSPCNL